MKPEDAPRAWLATWWGPAAAGLALALLRWLLLPGADPLVGGLSHDSAYLVLVADNLRAGRGYINDASWLVFLRPESLPMPYHNANPLYPTLMAWLADLLTISTVEAGFGLGALGSLLLFGGLVWLLVRLEVSPGRATILALGGTLFPPVFADSLKLVPDTLCSALAMLCLGCLVRGQRLQLAAVGGICFGLAWLTRSSVVLMLPAVAGYLLLTYGIRRGGTRFILFGLFAGLVALPWLVHTARVWGNPFRSDSSYYLWQSYHARDFDGSVERFWHSPQPPLSFLDLLRREPGLVVRHCLTGIPKLMRKLAADWCGTPRMAGLLGVLAFLALGKVPAWFGSSDVRRNFRPETVALLLFIVTMVLGFSPRGYEFEGRYFDLLATLLGVLLVYAGIVAFAERRYTTARQGAYHAILLTLCSFFWLFMTPLGNGAAYRKYGQPGGDYAAYQTLARQAQKRIGPGQTVVVGEWPYLYTLVNGVSALSIPEADDEFLRRYLKQYGARHVFLTREELKFWRPHWEQDGGLPRWLIVLEAGDKAVIYQVSEPAL